MTHTFENKHLIVFVVLANIVLLLACKACNTSRVTVMKPNMNKYR